MRKIHYFLFLRASFWVVHVKRSAPTNVLALKILTEITSALELHASFVYVINEYKMVQMKTSLHQRNINNIWMIYQVILKPILAVNLKSITVAFILMTVNQIWTREWNFVCWDKQYQDLSIILFNLLTSIEWCHTLKYWT